MKILFINSYPINRDWSTGNTFLNFFNSFPKEYSFHEISLRNGKFEPGFLDTAIVINEKAVIKSAVNREPVVALRCNLDNADSQTCMGSTSQDEKELKAYSYKQSAVMRYVGIFMRNFFWRHGLWKNAVKDYVTELKPDLIFFSTSGLEHLHNIMHYVHEVTGAPVVLFHADDHFTFKTFSLNPLFWLSRLSSRAVIKKAVEISSCNFCITQLQCDEYSKAMHKRCELLTKGLPFEEPVSFEQGNISKSIELVYTGNIIYDRWRTLLYIGRLLDELSKMGYNGILKIYTGNELSKKIKRRFDSVKSIRFMGAVPNSEIEAIQNNADVLVHVEAFGAIKKLKVRQSFSTKIVDYIHSGKCVLAAGAEDIAPIQYFSENGIGLVLSRNKKNDLQTLEKAFDFDTRRYYGEKAWEFGKKHHGIDAVMEKLINSFSKLG